MKTCSFLKSQTSHRLLLALLMLTGALQMNELKSQSIEFNNIYRDDFKGIKPLDQQGYYVVYKESPEETKSKKERNSIHINIMNNDLKLITDFKIELDRYETMDDISYNGANFLVVVADKDDKRRHYRLMDKSGKVIVSKKTDKMKIRLLSVPSNSLPIPNSSDFIVVNFIKDDDYGYNVERYNDKLEMLYSTEKMPEKAKLYPVDFLVVGDKLYILELVKRDMNFYFEYYVNSFDINTGKELKRVYLKSDDEKSFGFATFLKKTKNGGVATGGMYFNGPREDHTHSEGFFVTTMDKDGAVKSTYKPWEDLGSLVSEENSNAIWGGKTKNFVYDLAVNDNGSFVVITQNFKRGDIVLAGKSSDNVMSHLQKINNIREGKNSPEAFSTLDFVLIDFDKDANYVGARKLKTTSTITVIEASSDKNDATLIGQAKGLNLASILNNYGYLPYRFVATKGNVNYLVYDLYNRTAEQEKLFFTPLVNTPGAETTNATISSSSPVAIDTTGTDEEAIESKKSKSLLGALDFLSTDKNEIKNYFILKSSQNPHDFRAKAYSTTIFNSNIDGKILAYYYTPNPSAQKKKSFWSTLTGKKQLGTFKIYYFDIPNK